MSPDAPLVEFGWDFDVGEFAVRSGPLPRAAGEILYQAGFWYRAQQLGADAWHQHLNVEANEQIDNAAGAIDALLKAGVQVSNWHDPRQSGQRLVEHYAWLRDEGPFPDAAATADKARWHARAALLAGLDSDGSRTLASQIVDGDLVVEAMQKWETDSTQWWLAFEASSDCYLILRFDPVDRSLGITDHYADWYGPQARRDFRVQQQRDTSRPSPSRADAARTARPARMRTAPSAPPDRPQPPEAGRSARR
ncbi:hypothetical protein AB0D10_25255 [Kitasatospora sp. NPDC048545]|uniref:hypothetical protein n=1 Tax=Kitasatospora sp. NPDC048545 TaxID=3157208 RepID=UPI00340D2620